MSKEKLSIYGLGKLGCTMLACFAKKGWEVHGVDVLQKPVDLINQGKSPIYEPHVENLIKTHKVYIKASMDLINAALETDVSFIIVPTPSKKDGSFSSDYVETAIRAIGEALKQKNSYHLVVVTSTVMPGETSRMATLLEQISGKTCNSDFGVCYNPDFIALGKIVYDFLNPDMVLIGESDSKAGSLLESIHRRLIENNTKIHRMSLHNAELTKIGLNAYCTLKITYANIIGEICESLEKGNAQKVLNAIGDDSRVGRKYFKAGLGFGGPCFNRDNRAFNFVAKGLGISNTLAELTDTINEYQKKKRIPLIIEKILRDKKTDTLAVLGITYKEDVTLIEESPVIDLISALLEKGFKIKIYDPAGMEEGKDFFKNKDNILFCENIRNCLEDTQVCFIGTPWKEFKELVENDFIFIMDDNPVIFDAWNLFHNFSSEIDYRRIGLNK